MHPESEVLESSAKPSLVRCHTVKLSSYGSLKTLKMLDFGATFFKAFSVLDFHGKTLKVLDFHKFGLQSPTDRSRPLPNGPFATSPNRIINEHYNHDNFLQVLSV